jgi:hypothetical protein
LKIFVPFDTFDFHAKDNQILEIVLWHPFKNFSQDLTPEMFGMNNILFIVGYLIK